MKSLIILSSLYLLASCSHHGTQKRSVSFPYAPELVSEAQRSSLPGRGIASVELAELEQRSLRRTYFRALNHQYQVLGSLLREDISVKFCPQFHHDRIETTLTATRGPGISKRGDGQSGVFFPETSFSEDFTLKDYFAEIKAEIGTLCEEGVSDNYYKFDNLVTHYAEKRSFHLDPGSMASLLKIPVFANIHLTKMLQVRSEEPFSVHAEEKHVIELTRTEWFTTYLDRASKIRKDLLRNTMVKR